MPTKIEWTEEVWNPVRGCSKVSEGCQNCYAMRQANRFSGPGGAYEGLTKVVPGKGPQWTGDVRVVYEMLDRPLRWKKPRRVFVNSMSDLFHPLVDDGVLDDVFATMALADRHTFQILTKRPERALRYFSNPDTKVSICEAVELRPEWKKRTGLPVGDVHLPLPNVWLGVSVENQATADERIPHLLNTPAAVRWLSIEPLLESVDLGRLYDLRTISLVLHWVVVGGESGPGARALHPAWARGVRDQCLEAEVPFFFKQWGEWEPGRPLTSEEWVERGGEPEFSAFAPWELNKVGKKKAGRKLDGRTWDEYPETRR